jgi:hypothetical protein
MNIRRDSELVMVVLSDSLLAASLSASNSQLVFWVVRSDSIFFSLVSTFLRRVSTVSFDRPASQLMVLKRDGQLTVMADKEITES